MQNDEHGPVDSSRLCFVGYFNVIPCFRSLLISLLCISPLSISLLCFSPPDSVSLSSSLLSLSLPWPLSPALPWLPCPLRLDQRWQLQPPGSPLEAVPRAPWGAGGQAALPRSCSLGSGDAPCMSPHPWIVTTRNNRNKVNKSEKINK